MKPHIYRPGDQVQIVNPRWIKRVGYALRWDDLIDTPEIEKLAWEMTGMHSPPRYFLQAVAKLEVERRNFGGDERSIHYLPLRTNPEGIFTYRSVPPHGYVGHVALVEGKRVAHTGTRFPETGGTYYTQDGPDDWYEPGGLENRKTHIILRTTFGEIEACDVKLVKKGDGHA